MHTLLEHLPNELFFDIFQYIDTRDLHRGFWGLNRRLNNILQSLNNLSLIIEKNDLLLIKTFASQIVRLEINTWHEIDLKQFLNLKSLKLCHATRNYVNKIRPDILPKLVYLQISLAFDFWSSTQLAQDVFSNAFPFLRSADLGRVDIPYTFTWSLSPNLYFVSVCSRDPIIVPLILAACPCLHNLQVQIFGESHRIDLPSLRLNHPLKQFTLTDSYGVLSLNDINFILTYVPNVNTIQLTLFEMSFIRLAHVLINRLEQLKRFDCYINEPTEFDDVNTIRDIHSCFQRIQCIEKNHGLRYFTNK